MTEGRAKEQEIQASPIEAQQRQCSADERQEQHCRKRVVFWDVFEMRGSSIILMEAITKVGDGGQIPSLIVKSSGNIERDIVNISAEAVAGKSSHFLKKGMANPAPMAHLQERSNQSQ